MTLTDKMRTISNSITLSARNSIEKILRSVGFFYEYEIQTALGLADETIEKGSEESGYQWMTIIENNEMIAFATYGKNSFSTHSWDLYWIAVHSRNRNKKIGSTLLQAVENEIRKHGGKILWIETSGRPLYETTEAFYKKNGYILQASLKDFYATGDPKQIYSKVL